MTGTGMPMSPGLYAPSAAKKRLKTDRGRGSRQGNSSAGRVHRLVRRAYGVLLSAHTVLVEEMLDQVPAQVLLGLGAAGFGTAFPPNFTDYFGLHYDPVHDRLRHTKDNVKGSMREAWRTRRAHSGRFLIHTENERRPPMKNSTPLVLAALSIIATLPISACESPIARTGEDQTAESPVPSEQVTKLWLKVTVDAHVLQEMFARDDDGSVMENIRNYYDERREFEEAEGIAPFDGMEILMGSGAVIETEGG